MEENSKVLPPERDHYKLKYKLDHEVGVFYREDIKDGEGATHALFIASLIEHASGEYSQTFYSIDGNNDGEEISGDQLFKMWIMLSDNISRRNDVNPEHRDFAEKVLSMARKEIFGVCGDEN